MPRTAKNVSNETTNPSSLSYPPVPSFSQRSNISTPIFMVLLLVAAYLLGMLTTKVQYLEQEKTMVQDTAGNVLAADNAAPAPSLPPTKVDVESGHLAVLGDQNAKVTLVQFSDFQCPFCRRFFEETLPQIKKEYIDTGKVKLTFRHYPLDFHPAAYPSALAAECANEQGKFWELHDKIFEEQAKQGTGTVQYTIDDVKTWAAAIVMDQTQFASCIDSNKYDAQVKEDVADAQKVGVSGTPATYVNGMLVSGAQPYSVFKTIIDQELQKAN
jgi:protein-disulfide isomerase